MKPQMGGKYGGNRFKGLLGGPSALGVGPAGKMTRGMGWLMGRMGLGTPMLKRHSFVGAQDPMQSPGSSFRASVRVAGGRAPGRGGSVGNIRQLRGRK